MTSFTGVLYGTRFGRDDTGIDPLLESLAARWVYGAPMQDTNHCTQFEIFQESPTYTKT